MALNVKIRVGELADAETLHSVTTRSVEGLSAGHYTPAQIKSWMDGRPASVFHENLIAGRIRVAEFAGEVVGYVDAIPGEILRLFILPDFAGYGIGEQLLELGLELSAQTDSDRIILEATLNAETFYHRHGFTSVGRGRFSHGGEGAEPLEIVHMERKL